MPTKMVEIQTQSGLCDTYVAYPEDRMNLPVVLVYTDAIGLRKRSFEMADMLASLGYYVMVPNMFYRTKHAPLVDYDTLLKPENRPELLKQVMAIAANLKPDMAKRDVKDFLRFTQEQAQVNPNKVGIVGYCMGAGQALRAAGNYPTAFKAVATFHGGHLAVDNDTSPHLYFKNIQAEVYIAHADQDATMPPEQMEKVEKALKDAKVKHKTEVYKECLHGWTMSDLPAYSAAGEEKHWHAVLDLFARTLKN